MLQQKNRNRSQAKKRPITVIAWVLATIAILAAGLYYYHKMKPGSSSFTTGGGDGVVLDQLSPQKEWPKQDQPPIPGTVGQQKQQAAVPKQSPQNPAWQEMTESQDEKGLGAKEPQATTSRDNQANPDSPGERQPQIDRLNAFYSHLDEQPYIKEYGLGESTRVYFANLLQKLANNPPTVVRETDNLYTLLHNTAHFFRILGKKNITLIKQILTRESASFEKNAQAFYELTAQPEAMKKEYGLTIPPQVITDYSVFFLNTMGGRLYLFRRDSTTRMVITFYAIKTIDRANIAGNSGHGLDLRPAILALTEEMENGGKRLQLREQYLDALYDLQEKYN